MQQMFKAHISLVRLINPPPALTTLATTAKLDSFFHPTHLPLHHKSVYKTTLHFSHKIHIVQCAAELWSMATVCLKFLKEIMCINNLPPLDYSSAFNTS